MVMIMPVQQGLGSDPVTVTSLSLRLSRDGTAAIAAGPQCHGLDS